VLALAAPPPADDKPAAPAAAAASLHASLAGRFSRRRAAAGAAGVVGPAGAHAFLAGLLLGRDRLPGPARAALAQAYAGFLRALRARRGDAEAILALPLVRRRVAAHAPRK
jgi:hypothetical protein